jgi:hypothetical protein
LWSSFAPDKKNPHCLRLSLDAASATNAVAVIPIAIPAMVSFWVRLACFGGPYL